MYFCLKPVTSNVYLHLFYFIVDAQHFYAQLSKNTLLTGNKIVVFDVQRTDIDNVYNKFSGKFTAPSSGVYCFGVSFLARPSRGCHLELVRNGIRIGQGYASTPASETGHIQAVVYVNKGSKVWVRHISSYGTQMIEGFRWSSFVGFKI